ncbi:MAG: hypothetical protein HY575_08525, partial [candidate division NC10 bacterium]|nr:hypothetical protein [candidate division NC10 bacterium]
MTRQRLALTLAALPLLAGLAPAAEPDLRRGVLLHVIRREALFCSGLTGTWPA